MACFNRCSKGLFLLNALPNPGGLFTYTSLFSFFCNEHIPPISPLFQQWTSHKLSSRHSLDPILSHGSTLGLYEVLIGKPYICDMITDSVVHCFFVEAEKIERLRQSDPSVEVFLWQVPPSPCLCVGLLNHIQG